MSGHIGFHIGKNGRKWADAVAEDISALTSRGLRPCYQIFTHGPRRFHRNMTDEELDSIRGAAPVVIHGTYLDQPWTRNMAAVRNIQDEMKVAERLGATGVVVHLGAGAADEAVLGWPFEHLADAPDVILWLEINAAKPGPLSYETPAKIGRLFEKIARLKVGKLRVGLCIDTAHLFSCGVALTTAEDAREWLGGLPDIPIMLHLNDSASELGSGIDRHAPLTHGGIWKIYNQKSGQFPLEESGLYALLTWADARDCLVILERDPAGLQLDLELISGTGLFRT